MDDKGKANAFNDYFSQASSLDDNFREPPEILTPATSELDMLSVTYDDVFDQLSILDTKKAYGPDGLSPILLKEA